MIVFKREGNDEKKVFIDRTGFKCADLVDGLLGGGKNRSEPQKSGVHYLMAL